MDLATGFLYVEKTDLVLPTRVPLTVRRTYRSGLTGEGPFGLGSSWPYDVSLRPASVNSTLAFLLYSPGNRQDLLSMPV